MTERLPDVHGDYGDRCSKCGGRLTCTACDAEECCSDPKHSACEGWSGSCCLGGYAYAMEQLP